MAEDKNSIQQIIITEISYFFAPLIRTQGDPIRVFEYLKGQGLNLEALFSSNSSDFLEAVQLIIDSCTLLEELKNDPPKSLSEFTASIKEIEKIIRGISQLQKLVPASIDPDGKIAVELVNRLFTNYIKNRSETSYSFLRFLNIISFLKEQSTLVENNSIIINNSLIPVFDSKKLISYLSEPIQTFEEEFLSNGLATLEEVSKFSEKIYPGLMFFLNSLGFRVHYGSHSQFKEFSAEENEILRGLMTISLPVHDESSGVSAQAGLTMGFIPETNAGSGFFAVPFGNIGFSKDFENWTLTSKINAEVKGFEIRKDGVKFYGSGINSVKFDAAINRKEEAAFLFGSPDGTRLEINKFGFAAGLYLEADEREIFIKTIFEDCKLVISPSEGDGFLQSILASNPIEASFGITVGLNNLNGLYFEGGSVLEVHIPLHLKIGPFEVTNLIASIKPEGNVIPLELTATIKANLGPLVVVVENIGLKITCSLPEDGTGNLGPVNLTFGIKPPNGVGLSIDTGVIIGGGYLYIDTEKGSYAGALQLSINNFLSLTAIGLIETKMPDGSDGFSLLIIVTAEFSPAFQLGYGFTLNGVGGLLGLNREVLLDPLRDGVRTGAINGIMFPTDVIANAPAIISDMQAIFPVKEGYFLIGPMAKIGWGTPTLISLSLGVIIQLPDPKIAILGVLKIVLPTEEAAVLKLQVNFLGTIDPSNQLITFDASLFDSNILKVLTLTGDMAVRLRWGDKPDFILSAGGFHPEYEPTMSMPALQRIGIKILDLEQARIQVLTYFALTSNTVQFGARADCYFGLDGFSVYGYMGFDALMQFSPFCFEALAASGFTLDTALGDASIRINARLKGPTPWYVKATGSIEVFGFEFEAEYEKEWGKSQKEELPEIALKPLLLEEFKKKEVWSAALPEGTNQLISVSNPEIQDATAEPFIIYPNGNLIISQKLVPFKMKLEKLGNQMISDIHEVQISALNISGAGSELSDISDTFAIGQYLELSDQEKISKPSFESMKCGVKATWNSGTSSFKIGSTVRRSQEYEQIWIDKEKKKGLASFKTQKFTELLRGSAASKSKLSQKYRSALGKSVIKTAAKDLVFEVVNVNDHKLIDTTASFNSFVEASQYLNNISSGNEALRSGLTVIEK